LTEGRGFRREFFLLDTGAPKSIIIEEIPTSGLFVSERKYNNNPVIEVRTEFETQPWDEEEDRTRNINLLIDGRLRFWHVKRASPPISRI